MKISGNNWYRNILVYNPNNDETNLIFNDSVQIIKPLVYSSYRYPLCKIVKKEKIYNKQKNDKKIDLPNNDLLPI